MKEGWMINIGKIDLEYLDRLLNQSVWKAFATIHAGIHNQMKLIILFKFKKQEKGVAFGDFRSSKKWEFLKDKKREFSELANYLFVTGIIEEDFRDEILKFNKHRNTKLGHINIYAENEISDEDIKKLCLDGIKIIKELDEIFQEILFGKIIIKH